MRITSTYKKTRKAYAEGYGLISNRGSSRSGKSFAILQLLFLIAYKSPKRRMITCVSHSFPHLEMGIIRDFDNILIDEGIQPDLVRTKRPYIYKIGNSTIEFISVDNIGKSLGAARDILFVNEANKISFQIFEQLDIRTTETTFLDYNPDGEFWLEEHDLLSDDKAIEIHSTYKDNEKNLTTKQIRKFSNAKQKAADEERRGTKSYWYYWWQCYGLGLRTRMIDKMVFPKCKRASEIPKEANLLGYGIDFSNSENQNSDPHCIVGIYYCSGSIYIKGIYQGVAPVVYQENGQIVIDDSWNSLASICHYKCPNVNQEGERPFIADGANSGNIKLLQNSEIEADNGWFAIDIEPYERPYTISEGINALNSYENIYLIDDCEWLVKEFEGFVFDVDNKTGNIIAGKPAKDQDDHAIAAARYAIQPWQRL